nr:Biomphalaria glabrata 1-phosphatidylinositol 4; 5-bisphosphate phosphodiesterase beta-4-like; transcript variant X5 [Biomphalaria glabrata]
MAGREQLHEHYDFKVVLSSQSMGGVSQRVESVNGWSQSMGGASQWVESVNGWSQSMGGASQWVEPVNGWSQSMAGREQLHEHYDFKVVLSSQSMGGVSQWLGGNSFMNIMTLKWC